MWRSKPSISTIDYIVLAVVLILGLVAGLSYMKSKANSSLGHEGNMLRDVATGNYGDEGDHALPPPDTPDPPPDN